MNLSNPTRFVQVLLALLVVNTSVWLGLGQVSVPDSTVVSKLEMNIIRGGHEGVSTPDFAPDIAVLDQILAQRVSVEASRRGTEPVAVLPSAELRAAALRSGEIQGVHTRALVAAYQQALDDLVKEQTRE